MAGFVGGNGYESNRANWVDVSFVDCVNSGDIRGASNNIAGFIGEAYHTGDSRLCQQRQRDDH